ncbi:MAG: DNA recombination protein RmuC [Verrucomicrobiota bacterium]
MRDLFFHPLIIGPGALLVGVITTYFWAKQAIALARLRERQEVSGDYEAEIRDLTAQLAGAKERQLAFEEAQRQLQGSFRALSAEALKDNNRSFLELARSTMTQVTEGSKVELEKRQQAIASLVAPVRESLAAVDLKIAEMEKNRVGAYESLKAVVGGMEESQKALRTETGNLVRALQSPVVRGRWGEIQLKRVVELAGMVEHCDFFEQQSVETLDGRLRPDMVVVLPGGHSLVVDSKVSLMGYLEALQAGDDAGRKGGMARHATQVRTHIDQLSRKAYWEQFEATPEFVVLFLPGEVFFSAALEVDPELIAYGAEKRIILASPTTLIALLRAVHHGWRQEALAENAAEISALGRELHKRLGDFAGHLAKLGNSLGSAVEHYNRATGSLESRVLVSARRFEDLKAANSDAPLPELTALERVPVQPRLEGE